MDTIWKSRAVVEGYLQRRAAVPMLQQEYDLILRLIRSAKREVGCFLDLGCGDGVLAALVLGEYRQAKGTLVDFSEPMLELARAKLGAYSGQLDFVAADYSESAWKSAVLANAPFDLVLSGFSIHHHPDRRKRGVYAEIYALLKPGGWFINLEHVASTSKWIESIWDEYAIDLRCQTQPANAERLSREEIARGYFTRPDKEANILALVEDQCAWLREIGFQDVDCYFKFLEIAIFGGRRADS